MIIGLTLAISKLYGAIKKLVSNQWYSNDAGTNHMVDGNGNDIILMRKE